MQPVLLASASPRRRMLLEQVGFRVAVHPVDVDERAVDGEQPVSMARRLAREKAEESVRSEGRTPWAGVAADTVVWTAEGLLLGKPGCDAEAEDMLRSLSGRTHHVTTGYCVFGDALGDRLVDDSVTTDVDFRELDDDVVRSYVRTGEPRDKAGAYGIQGMGAVLVRGIRGSYTNVVGLPVAEVVRSMRHHGLLGGMPWEDAGGRS